MGGETRWDKSEGARGREFKQGVPKGVYQELGCKTDGLGSDSCPHGPGPGVSKEEKRDRYVKVVSAPSTLKLVSVVVITT